MRMPSLGGKISLVLLLLVLVLGAGQQVPVAVVERGWAVVGYPLGVFAFRVLFVPFTHRPMDEWRQSIVILATCANCFLLGYATQGIIGLVKKTKGTRTKDSTIRS